MARSGVAGKGVPDSNMELGLRGRHGGGVTQIRSQVFSEPVEGVLTQIRGQDLESSNDPVSGIGHPGSRIEDRYSR